MKKIKMFLVSFTIAFLTMLIFITVGFLYLYSSNKTVENKAEKVPYYQLPENTGIVFEIGQSEILFFIDFEIKAVSILHIENEVYTDEIYGYPIDFRVKSDYEIVEELVDTVGGIDLKIGEETYNYTGTQVVELICTTVDIEPLKRMITEKIMKKFGEIGMTMEEFIFIIENCETDLTVPDCYFWPEYMGEICKNARYVN